MHSLGWLGAKVALKIARIEQWAKSEDRWCGERSGKHGFAEHLGKRRPRRYRSHPSDLHLPNQ